MVLVLGPVLPIYFRRKWEFRGVTLDEGKIDCVHVSVYGRGWGAKRGRLCEVSLGGWNGCWSVQE
jgi:hypothetical protein